MSRADRWALVLIALVLGGCMRIYPDPELPDVEVEWFTGIGCDEDAERVVVAITAFDTDEASTVTAPCGDGRVRVEDIARVRYHLEVRLEGADGAVLSTYQTDVDLRDGLSKRVSTFLNRERSERFTVAWTFDMGASCESLSTSFMQLVASGGNGEPAGSWGAPCTDSMFMSAFLGPEPISLALRAISPRGVLAISPPSELITPVANMVVDFGTITLSPCDGPCPVEGVLQGPPASVAR